MTDKTDILAALTTLPGEIKAIEESMLDKSSKIETMQLKLDLIELGTRNEVESETDMEGKKLYSNDLKRKVEADSRLQKNDDFRHMLDEMKELKRQLKIDDIMASYKKRVFSATQAIAQVLYSR